MKKLISLVLILCMACMLVPAMAELNVTGDWYLKIMKMGDEEYDAASIGYVMTMTLKEDGTVSMTTAGVDEVSTGTWTLEGDQITVTIDGAPASGTATEESISLGADDQFMIFTREATEAISVAEVKTDAAAEDFNGVWTAKYVGAAGVVIDAAMAGQEMPGIILKDSTLDFTGESSLGAAFGQDALPMTFENGALEFKLSLGSLNMSIKAELLQDGMLAVTFDVGTELVLYMEKTGEAPAA